MNGIEKISARILADAEAECRRDPRAGRGKGARRSGQSMTGKLEDEQQRRTLEAQNEAQKQLEQRAGRSQNGRAPAGA